jgi:hypothetical protein
MTLPQEIESLYAAGANADRAAARRGTNALIALRTASWLSRQ